MVIAGCRHKFEASSPHCIINKNGLNSIVDLEIIETIDSSWRVFPNYGLMAELRKASLLNHSDEKIFQYDFVEGVSFSDREILVGIHRTAHHLHILDANSFEIVQRLFIPVFCSFLFAESWNTSKGGFLIVYAALRGTSNLSILYVLDENFELIYRECFSRADALAVGYLEGFGDILGVRSRINNVKYFYW